MKHFAVFSYSSCKEGTKKTFRRREERSLDQYCLRNGDVQFLLMSTQRDLSLSGFANVTNFIIQLLNIISILKVHILDGFMAI